MHLDISKILEGLESLSRAGVTVSSMIIDDKWQKINDHENPDLWQCAWEDFEADKKCFPNGLKSAITTIREKYPALKDIAIWHALLGYWGGMSPSGHIAQKYRMIQDKALLQGHVPAVVHTVHPKDVYRIYDNFYRLLSSCGITSVKTDVQFMIDQFQSTKVRGSVPTAYQSAWTTAHLRHFQGKAISCMSMIPQILFHSFLPTNNPVCVMRNSDDFFQRFGRAILAIFSSMHITPYSRRISTSCLIGRCSRHRIPTQDSMQLQDAFRVVPCT
jgi:hypothetical protein